MTVYKWTEMSPRERDALVAEKVMGHEYYTIECQLTHEVFEYWRGDRDLKLRPYTTDISAAWEVVEKLRHKDPCINWLDQAPFDPVGWHACIGEQHAVGCVTACEAICLAALKAVLADIE